MADKTFVFHSDWVVALQQLPIDQQDKVIADLVRYGCREPLMHGADPVVASLVNQQKRLIDVQINKYQKVIAMGQNAGRKKIIDDKMIYDLAQQGKKSQEIAEILGCSKSAVDHSEGWRQRKKSLQGIDFSF